MSPEPSLSDADWVSPAVGEAEGDEKGVGGVIRYMLPPEECKFNVSDVVWGKIRSHPWWPAQIFDTADASEEALKHRKKDGVLVAYFGDHTYAWNDKASLRPFRDDFAKMSVQSGMGSFLNAVDCAVDEICRRVEFGLVCFCAPGEVYGRVKSQDVDNAGIRDGAGVFDGAYGSYNMTSFEPDKLVAYLGELARCPFGGYDKLDLAIAKAQLLSFYRTKGFLELPQYSIRLAWPDMEMERALAEAALVDSNKVVEDGTSEPKKPKNRGSSSVKSSFPEDGFGKSKKQRTLADLMEYKTSDSSEEKDHHKPSSISKDSGRSRKRKTWSKYVDKATSLKSEKTFKVGACISKVAFKLTQSSLSPKGSDRAVKRSGELEESIQEDLLPEVSPVTHWKRLKSLKNLLENSSADELLSELCVAAQGPLSLDSYLPTLTLFFSDYRDNSLLTKGSVKINLFEAIGKSTESESDVDDSASGGDVDSADFGKRTDHVAKKMKKRIDPATLPVEKDDNQLSNANAAEVSNDVLDEESSPSALILNFSEVDSLPSQADLVKIFGQYGPLVKSETQIMKKTKRAKVVFKKKEHAEVAFSSAGKFHIFGPALVSYRLRYLPSPSKPTVSCKDIERGKEKTEGGGSPLPALTDLNIQMVDVAHHDNGISYPLTENGVQQETFLNELSNQDTNLISRQLGSEMHLDSEAKCPSVLSPTNDKRLECCGGNLIIGNGDSNHPLPQTPGPVTDIAMQDNGETYLAQAFCGSSI